MNSRVRVSHDQLMVLLEFMELHGDLSRPAGGPQGRLRSDRLWSDLINILNSSGGGVTKTIEKWKKVWADWKTKTKKKSLTLQKASNQTGGGPGSSQTLSEIDQRVLAIMGPLAVSGLPSVQELGFVTTVDPVLSQSSLGEENAIIVPMYMGEIPTSPSPQPATRQESPSPPPLEPVHIVLQQQDPVSAAARRRLSTDILHQQIHTPVATPRRERRRRRGVTPFERASNQFVSIEMARLDNEKKRAQETLQLEEKRLQLQHERDMLALKIDQEKTAALTSIVCIARDWLDYLKSKENTQPINTD